MASKRVKVDVLTRVEGEGGLEVRLKDGKLRDVKLRIYEPPRFFEGFLRGRRADEAPDLTARICGICPVAYQMSAAQAIEQAFGVTVDERVRALRRLLYCGEWIESHALHIYLLHAPDFLGYESSIAMAADHREAVERGLQLKKLGNDIMNVVGGREIHPINVRVGGFYKAPAAAVLRPLGERLRRGLDAARETVRWTSGFAFPDLEQDYEFVALRHPHEYAVLDGRIVSNRGLDVAIADFEEHLIEEHVPHSNALHAVLRGRGSYHVGPLARYAINHDKLRPLAREAAHEAALGPVVQNPFRSIVVRAVELVHACEEALALLADYAPPEPAAVPFAPRAGVGCGASEAPRGLLYHRYRLDAQGVIEAARIVPPTSQNQKTIENDLWQLVPRSLALPEAELVLRCEQAVRNYDPCISCATHFLRLTLRHDP